MADKQFKFYAPPKGNGIDVERFPYSQCLKRLYRLKKERYDRDYLLLVFPDRRPSITTYYAWRVVPKHSNLFRQYLSQTNNDFLDMDGSRIFQVRETPSFPTRGTQSDNFYSPKKVFRPKNHLKLYIILLLAMLAAVACIAYMVY